MGVILSVTLVLSLLLIPSSSADVDFLNDTERRRRNQQDDFVCPYAEETLYYNIEIFIEGLGEGCAAYDLYNIGAILQKIVAEVEEEIPEYENERMDTIL